MRRYELVDLLALSGLTFVVLGLGLMILLLGVL